MGQAGAYTSSPGEAGGKTTSSNTTGHDAYRAKLNFRWKPEIWSSDAWALSLNRAFNVMTFRDKNSVEAISCTPNIILAPGRTTGLYPYAQVGFGAAYLSDDKFESDGSPGYRFNGTLVYDDGTSDMGSRGEFESSLALGLVKDRFSVRAKIYQYSNANITSNKRGIDVAEFGGSYSF
jgi:hypothetical protein